MRKNTFDIPQEEMDRFHKAMDAERTEQDARLEKLIESEKANIPSNEAIIKMIPSKAVREYLQKIGHQFSERDRYLLWLYLDPKKEDESEELWEKGRYVSVPHPFRRGDIVVCYASCPAFTNSGEHKGKYSFKRRNHQNDSVKGCARIFTENRTSVQRARPLSSVALPRPQERG